ncbi:MAG: hypothetical protein ACRC2T_16930 [Thermoguttaceae bacterium]
MKRISRKLSEVIKLLCKAQFFLVFERITNALLPSYVFRTSKKIFFKLDDNKEQDITLCGNDEIEIFPGTQSDVTKIVDDIYCGDAGTLAFYTQFYDSGVEPWCAKQNDKIVGVVWVYTGYYISQWEGYDHYTLRLKFEPTGKFVSNVFVMPTCRGRRIFPKIACAIIDRYSTSPFYTSIEAGNNSSIRAHEVLGFSRCGCVYYFRFFSLALGYFSSKKHGMRFFRHKKGCEITVEL